jgi:hypothetical protein
MHNLGKMIWLQLAKREIEQPDLKSALLTISVRWHSGFKRNWQPRIEEKYPY